MTDLEMTPTPDLLHEIHRRFDHSVFVGWTDHNETQDLTTVNFKGGAAPTLGLLEFARARIHRIIRQNPT